MSRIVAIDYGLKRCGIAMTDPLRIIAQGVTTVKASELMEYLDNFLHKESFEILIVGLPKQMNNTPSQIEPHIAGFIKRFKIKHPQIEIIRVDERFTSILSHQALLMGGATKKQRSNKELVDSISATIILQTYLERKQDL